MIHSDYLNDAFDLWDRDLLIKKITKKLRYVSFDSVAFTGLSGALIAPIIAYELNKGVIAVRKKKDKSHSKKIVEGILKRYIIIDDIIEYGDTIKNIIKSIEIECIENQIIVPELTGIVLYNQTKNNYDLDFKMLKRKRVYPRWIMYLDGKVKVK